MHERLLKLEGQAAVRPSRQGCVPSWRRAAFREIAAWVENPPGGRALLLSGARQVGKTTLFLHHLLTEEDHAWLKSMTTDALSADEAKALIYARETGAVDNTACRDFSGLDTLQASNVFELASAWAERHDAIVAATPAQSRDVVFIAYPRMSLLDLSGAQTVFWAASKALADAAADAAAAVRDVRA